MADRSPRRVALLSIHPRHATAILDGQKQVELRRVPVRIDTTHVIVYATAPVQALLGWFEVAGVHQAPPSRIWKDHGSVCGVTRSEFRSYFAGARKASAIRVGRLHRFPGPVALDELPQVRRPPQSFQYVDLADAERLFVGRPITHRYPEPVVVG